MKVMINSRNAVKISDKLTFCGARFSSIKVVPEQSLVPESEEIPTESPEPPLAPDSVEADHGVTPVQEEHPQTTHSYSTRRKARLDYACT